MGVRYSNGKVMWLGRPFACRTFWTINRLFQSGFQTTIWIPDHLTSRHLNSRLVQYSNGYCLLHLAYSWVKSLTFEFFYFRKLLENESWILAATRKIQTQGEPRFFKVWNMCRLVSSLWLMASSKEDGLKSGHAFVPLRNCEFDIWGSYN